MAYSDYGAFVHLNGERRRDKEDVGVYDTDEANLPSGMRIYANLMKNYPTVDSGPTPWYKHSQHGVMGDGNVRCACYKQGFPTVYVWPEDQDEPTAITQEQIIEHNGWTLDDPWISEVTWGEQHYGELYINTYDCHEFIEFTVPGLDGYEFTHECGCRPKESTMKEPDGSYWTCSHDYCYGAGWSD